MRRALCRLLGKSPSPSSSSSSSSVATASTSPADPASFGALVRSRRAARSFSASEPVPGPVLLDALELCQRSPSAFNLQPYRVVLVRDAYVRHQLAYCMTSSNIRRVLRAPATAVFLCDLEPWRLLDDLEHLLRSQAGSLTEHEIANLRADASFILGWRGGVPSDSLRNHQNASSGAYPSSASGGDNGDNNADGDVPPGGARRKFAGNEGASLLKAMLGFGGAGEEQLGKLGGAAQGVEMGVKKALMEALSHVTQAPTVPTSAEVWATKSSMLAAQTFMLAVAAHGYDSCPMEGFDSRRIKEALGVPQGRYSVPLVVSVGVSDEEIQQGDQAERKQTPRFAFEDVFCADSFDFPLSKEQLKESPETAKNAKKPSSA